MVAPPTAGSLEAGDFIAGQDYSRGPSHKLRGSPPPLPPSDYRGLVCVGVKKENGYERRIKNGCEIKK